MDSATGDYKEGSFSIEFSVVEGADSGKVRFNYQVQLDEPGLANLRGKMISAVVFLICKDTFTDKLFILDGDAESFEVDEANLRGKIELLPLLVARNAINNFESQNLHDEFAKQTWAFSEADVLAIGARSIFSIGHEKLAPIASIFKLAINESIENDIVIVDIESETIEIHVNEQTMRLIENMRAQSRYRSLVLNSIYLPAVMDVLSKLSTDAERLSDKGWYKPFMARCDVMGIDVSNINPLKDAQMLLNKPIRKLEKILEAI